MNISNNLIHSIVQDTHIVVLDLETNGLETGTAILEVGAIIIPAGGLFSRSSWQEYESLVYFDGKPNPGAFAVNQLDPRQLRERGRDLGGILSELSVFCRGSVLVGHNIIDFDLRVLEPYLKTHEIRLNNSYIFDTKRAARQAFPAINCSLRALSSYFGLTSRPTHRALADVLSTAELFSRLIDVEKPLFYNTNTLSDDGGLEYEYKMYS